MKFHRKSTPPVGPGLNKGDLYHVPVPGNKVNAYKVGEDGMPYFVEGITQEQSLRIEQLTQPQITKLAGLKTQAEIDQDIADIASKSTSEYFRLADGVTELPNPVIQGGNTLTNAWTWLKGGVTYTIQGGGTIEAVGGDLNRADYNGTTWSLKDMGDLPSAPVVDNVESESATEALSAKQGKLLNTRVVAVQNSVYDVNKAIYKDTKLGYLGVLPFRYYNNVDNTSYVESSGLISQTGDENYDTFDLTDTESSNVSYFDTGIAISFGVTAIIEFLVERKPSTGSLGIGLGVVGASSISLGTRSSNTNTFITRFSPRTGTTIITASNGVYEGTLVRIELDISDTGEVQSKVFHDGILQYQGASGFNITSGNWAISAQGNEKVRASKIIIREKIVAQIDEVVEISKVTTNDLFFSDETIIENKLNNTPYNFESYVNIGYGNGGYGDTQSPTSDGLNVTLTRSGNPDNSIAVFTLDELWDKKQVSLKFTPKVFKSANPAIGLAFGNIANRTFVSLLYRMNGQVFTIHSGETGFDTLPVLWGSRALDPTLAMELNVEHEIVIDFETNTAITKIGGVSSEPIQLLQNEITGAISLVFRGVMDADKLSINGVKVERLSEWRNNVEESIKKIGDSESKLPNIKADVLQISSYGQSLSVGTQSNPPISTVQKYNSKMFQGGLRILYDYEGGVVPSDYYSDFVPLIEFTPAIADPRFGETPCSGISEIINERLLNRGIDYHSTNEMTLLLSAPGRGSTGISGLSKGTAPYTALINEVQQGYNVAQSKGLTHNVPAITWNQGESDISLGTEKEVYKTLLNQLQIDLNNDIKDITGQENDVFLVCYQTMSQNVRTPNNGYTGIGEAQFECALENPLIIMSHSAYTLGYVSDNVHLTNVGSKINGAYHGLAIYKLLNSEPVKPVHVSNYTVQGKIINLEFHVPSLPLVFDITLVSQISNYGFRLFNETGTEVTIDSVNISRGNIVKIVSNVAVSEGFEIRYAMNGSTTGVTNGARGNLRDSQDIVFDKEGLNAEMYNWCPMFRLVL